MVIRTVLATRDPNTKDALDRVLSVEPGVEIAGATETEQETIQAVVSQRPHLLVIDLEILSAAGIEMLNLARIGVNPMVVATVKSDAEADSTLKKLDAVDYLITPVDEKCLREVIGKVRSIIGESGSTPVETTRDSKPDPRDLLILEKRLVFKSAGRIMFLDMEEVDWIEASANYVRIHSGSLTYTMRETIGNIAERLGNLRFVRVHRSIIVNFAKVRELQTCNGSEYIVVLRNGKELPCSRAYRKALDRSLFESVG